MKAIKDVKEALRLFEEAAVKRANAMDMSRSKIANRNADKLDVIEKYLRECKSLHELAVFYDHPNVWVRTTIATYLLPVNEKKSLEVLAEITKLDGIVSLEAEMTIKEWNSNANLRERWKLT